MKCQSRDVYGHGDELGNAANYTAKELADEIRKQPNYQKGKTPVNLYICWAGRKLASELAAELGHPVNASPNKVDWAGLTVVTELVEYK